MDVITGEMKDDNLFLGSLSSSDKTTAEEHSTSDRRPVKECSSVSLLRMARKGGEEAKRARLTILINVIKLRLSKYRPIIIRKKPRTIPPKWG